MPKFIDMSGWKMWEHGVPDSRLTVIKRVEDYIDPCGHRKIRWLCECNCDEHNQIIATGDQIRDGNIKSCGCLHKEFLNNLHENNRKRCKYDIESFDYGVGWTTNTNKEFYFDLEDYDKIKNYAWREETDRTGYHFLSTSINGEYIIMAWLIVGKFYDHEDRNPFNNRKYNLRPSTAEENARNRSIPSNNTSGIIGIHWCNTNHYWVAQIGYKGERIRIGTFSNKQEAIKARLKAELKYFGSEFAPQRHLFAEYGIE